MSQCTWRHQWTTMSHTWLHVIAVIASISDMCVPPPSLLPSRLLLNCAHTASVPKDTYQYAHVLPLARPQCQCPPGPVSSSWNEYTIRRNEAFKQTSLPFGSYMGHCVLMSHTSAPTCLHTTPMGFPPDTSQRVSSRISVRVSTVQHSTARTTKSRDDHCAKVCAVLAVPVCVHPPSNPILLHTALH